MRMMNIARNSTSEAMAEDLEQTKGDETNRSLSPAVLTTTLIPFVLDGIKVVDSFYHTKNTSQHPSENITDMDSHNIRKTTVFEGVKKADTNTSNISDINYNTEENVLYESVEDTIVQDDMSEEQDYLSRENTDGMNGQNSIKRNTFIPRQYVLNKN